MSRWSNKEGKDEEMLRELREISNKYSLYGRKKRPRLGAKPKRVADGNDEEKEDHDGGAGRIAREGFKGNNFLSQTAENRDLNQYWYSKRSIDVLCDAIREGLSTLDGGSKAGGRVAFLSAPSLFFSLTPEERRRCALLDYGASLGRGCEQYVHYDFNRALDVDARRLGRFDLIYINSPFVTGPVWRKYAATARILAREGGARVVAATVAANAGLMEELFRARPAAFAPRLPGLVYQFTAFANFECAALSEANGELG